MTYTEAIETIVSEGMEEKAVYELLTFIFRQRDNAQSETAEHRACLNAIHKINKARKMDDAIDALSELK